MRRKRIWLALLATAMVVVPLSESVYAATLVGGTTAITVDGRLGNDWGVGAPTGVNGNNWAPTLQTGINPGNSAPTYGGGWVYEDSVSGNVNTGYVGPQYGGQDFDVEALYTGYNITNQTLYVALVTGFDIGGELDGSTLYTPGDIFIDFGRYAPDYDNTFNSVSDSAWDLSFVVRGETASSTQLDARRSPFNSVQGTPYNVAGSPSGPLFATGGTIEQNAVNFGYSDNGALDGWNAAFDHNVYEFSYKITDVSLFNQMIFNSNNGTGGWTVHWTMSCGNDFLTAGGYLDPGTTFQTPVVPVPAAAPMGLVGMIALGLFRKVRAKKS